MPVVELTYEAITDTAATLSNNFALAYFDSG